MPPMRVPQFSFGHNLSYLAITGLIALYIGVSGWLVLDMEEAMAHPAEGGGGPYVLNGLSFGSETALQAFIAAKRIERFSPWAMELPPKLVVLLTAVAFGFVGGNAPNLRLLASGRRVTSTLIIYRPAFGAVVGLMIFAAATIAPTAVNASDDAVSPVWLVFLCLLCGAFSELAYGRLRQFTESVLKLKLPSLPDPI